MATTRFRLQVKFWLDLHKSEESSLADLIAELKQARTFSRVVRDGIRLVADLGQGDLDVLLTLFPWVEDAFYERFKEQQPASDSALQQQLARLEKLLIEQGSWPVDMSITGPKKLAIPITTPPINDNSDDSLLVIKPAKSEHDSSQNFLNSAFDLVQ